MSKFGRLLQATSALLANGGKRLATQSMAVPRLTNRFVLPKLSQGDSYYGLLRLDRFRVEDTKAYKDHLHQYRLQTRLDISTDPLRDLGHSQGDVKLQNIRYWLNNLKGWVRSADQKLFHEHFLAACLPHIYGRDWHANGARVLASLGIKKIDYEVLIQTPRRFGKTIAVAMFVAVLALFCPGIKISIFSTGSRASKAMTDRVLQFVNYIPGGLARKIKQSKEELMFSARPLGKAGGPGSALARAAENADDTSQIKSYPASVDSKLIETSDEEAGAVVCLCVRSVPALKRVLYLPLCLFCE